MGAVETLICWENLDVQRYTLKNSSTGEEKILHLSQEQEKDVTHFQVNAEAGSLSRVKFLTFKKPVYTGKVP
jgi:peptide chain release factor subunit 1